jgi:regulatory protein
MFSNALQYGIKSLSHKRQTEAQIREKILNYYPTVDIEALIVRLKELNYINDKEFTSAWIHYRSITSPRGKYALQQELKKKGIASDDRAEALSHYDEEPDLRRIAEQKWAIIKDPTPKKRKQKLMRFLLSRGFTISKVLEVVNSVARTRED